MRWLGFHAATEHGANLLEVLEKDEDAFEDTIRRGMWQLSDALHAIDGTSTSSNRVMFPSFAEPEERVKQAKSGMEAGLEGGGAGEEFTGMTLEERIDRMRAKEELKLILQEALAVSMVYGFRQMDQMPMPELAELLPQMEQQWEEERAQMEQQLMETKRSGGEVAKQVEEWQNSVSDLDVEWQGNLAARQMSMEMTKILKARLPKEAIEGFNHFMDSIIPPGSNPYGEGGIDRLQGAQLYVASAQQGYFIAHVMKGVRNEAEKALGEQFVDEQVKELEKHEPTHEEMELLYHTSRMTRSWEIWECAKIRAGTLWGMDPENEESLADPNSSSVLPLYSMLDDYGDSVDIVNESVEEEEEMEEEQEEMEEGGPDGETLSGVVSDGPAPAGFGQASPTPPISVSEQVEEMRRRVSAMHPEYDEAAAQEYILAMNALGDLDLVELPIGVLKMVIFDALVFGWLMWDLENVLLRDGSFGAAELLTIRDTDNLLAYKSASEIADEMDD